MGEAVALGERGRGRTAPNPNVGCVIVQDGEVVGRGGTQRRRPAACRGHGAGRGGRGGARRHRLRDARALRHESARGPACADLLVEAEPERVVVALADPDPRTTAAASSGCAPPASRSRPAPAEAQAARSMAGFLTRMRLGRPFITLKLAMSIDGKIALPSGESRWITGEEARAHVHLERARVRHDPGRPRHLLADAPRLDVRLPGLEDRSPRRALLTRGEAVEGWVRLGSPDEVLGLARRQRPAGRGRLGDRLRLPRRRPRRPDADLPRAGADRRGQVVGRLYRPRRDRRRPWPLAPHREPSAWHRPARSLRAPAR